MLDRPAEPSLYQARVNSFRLLPSRSQAIVRASMHTLRSLWEQIERARRAAKSKSDLLSLVEAPIKRRFLLACIGQTIAVPAREQLAGTVQQRDTPPAISTARRDRADEPRTLPAKAARRPGDRHTLGDGLLIGGPQARWSVDQNRRIGFGEHDDFT